MPTVQAGYGLSGGGVSINQTVSRTVEQASGWEIPLPAGKAGSLTTRTDDNAGEATLGNGHGITDGMIVDVHWDGGVRYGMTVGTVASLVVPIDGGDGDVLPAQATSLVVCEQVPFVCNIDGDQAQFVAICLESAEGTSGKGHLDLVDSLDASIEEIDLIGNTPKVWDIAAGLSGGETNIFTGELITTGKASNGSSAYAATLKIIAALDPTV